MEHDKLIVMAEFCSSGIWVYREDSTGGMIDFEDLNISKELQKDFEEWIRFYDCKCHESRHFSFIDKKADELNEKGRELAKKLKTELPGVDIYFWGESGSGMLDRELVT